jgi:predicted nucleic acid-binding protein
MRALDVLNQHKQSASGVVSLQVLQEYFVTVTRKYGIGAADARRKVELFAAFDVVEPVLGDVLAAIDLHRLHNVSYWDALVIHSARSAGCKQVFSEDMQHGQVIDGVRIVNPFL